ncbi:MAG TPA: MraY family glycosyltransferase [Pyrinomonadaceae bacterium]|nr:MraY family glycosyltransferase [Pyrinomonadaceae bacterium]
MKTYLTLFIAALFASTLLTPLVRRACERLGWLDRSNAERRAQTKSMPRLGGVAIYTSVLVTLALSALPLVDNLITQFVRANSRQLLVILLPATLVFMLGIYDDVRGTSAPFKLSAQMTAAVLFYVLGGRVEALSVPFVGTVVLPPILGFALTLVWVVGITNAFNLIDGMDGLAAGAALFSSLVIMVVSIMSGDPLVTLTAIALCGALLGFLRYNFNPASIFMGDSGSLFVGFTLAALSVQGSQKASTAIAVAIPLMTFAVPMVDTAFTILRRFLSGQPLMKGDREHIHHMLLERGWSQRRVVMVLYGFCALFGLMALLFVNETGGHMTGLVLFVVGMAVWLAIGRLRYHEMDEVRASVRRNLSERRLRGANNIRVRRACRALSKATTLGEIFNAVEMMLAHGEFAYATAHVGLRRRDGAQYFKAPGSEPSVEKSVGAQLHEGMISWLWRREDVASGGEEVIGSNRFWTLRLPLSTPRAEWGYINFYREFGRDQLLLDMNYMCNIFQRELAGAVERVLSTSAVEEAEKARAPRVAVNVAGAK